MNGYITLGKSLRKILPPESVSGWAENNIPIIAPLWADIETKDGTSSGVNIQQLFSDSDKMRAIETALNQSGLR